jgi:hypothetical protein
MYIPTIKPNRPIALPKISTIRIFTNNVEFAASASAAPEPEINDIKDIKLLSLKKLIRLKFKTYM